MKTSVKALIGASALAIASLVNAQPVLVYGQDQNANPAEGIIDIDQDWQTPSETLANLCGFTIGYSEPPVSLYGETYDNDPVNGGPFWSKTFCGCSHAPDSVDGDFENGFTVTYTWGSGTLDSSDAGTYTGTYTGANDPSFDSGELVVVVDPTFAPQSITLTGTEVTAGGNNDFIFSLAP